MKDFALYAVWEYEVAWARLPGSSCAKVKGTSNIAEC